jgi:broad specificity phosphatase PhoE
MIPNEHDEVLPLVRHVPTKLNKGEGGVEKSRGWLSTPPDPEELEKMAPQIAEKLREFNVKKLVSSDLPRASITAKHIARIMDVPHESTPELRTWDVGNMAGKPEKTNLPLKKQYIEEADLAPPGGEPFQQFHSRWKGQLHRYMDWNEAHPDRRVALVVHGNMVMTARSILDGDKVNDKDWDMDKPGSVALVHMPKSGDAHLELERDREG